VGDGHRRLQRSKTTDPNGVVTTATYDSAGQVLTRTDGTGTTTYTYNGLELPTSITDPSGTTTITYDAGTDRVHSSSRPIVPGTGTATQTFTYGDAANPGLPTSVVDTRGKTWLYGYDSYGDLTSATDPTARTSTSVYNVVGWPLSSVAPAGNATGGNPAQQTTSYVYDKDGNVTSTTDAAGATTQFDYDASNNVIARRDPVASGAPVEQTSYTYDDADELTTVTRPDSTQLTTEYFADGSVKAQHDAANNVTSYTYDSQDRLQTTTDPDGHVTTLGYDAGGRVVTRQQPGGNCSAAPKTGCVSYSYYDSGQPHVVDYSDGATPDVTYTYDYPNRTKTMADSSGTSTWVYDSLGRLQSFTDPSGTVGYTFTDAGPATSLTYPGGKTVARTFDDAGRQLTSTAWTGGTATYGYDANANLATINTPATTGVEDTFGYDQANRMTGYTLRKATTVLGSITYTRDPEGMVSTSTGSGLPGVSDTLGYKPTDMLASDSTGTYSYDTADNLSSLPDGTKQRFDAADQLCYSGTTNTNPCTTPPAGATRFDYDSHGNRIAQRPTGQAATTMAYDQADRLVTAKVPAAPDGSSQYHDLSAIQNYLQTNVNYTAGVAQTLQVSGTHSVPAASQVASVLFRLTSSNVSNFGKVTVMPNGTAPPANTEAMLVDPGELGSVLAVSKLDANGKIQVSASVGLTLSIEIIGWYSSALAAGGLTFTATTGPTRVLSKSVTAASTTTVTVAGVGGVPSTGVSAVAVTLHSIGASAAGYFTAYSGTPPVSASLAYDAGTSASELTVVPVVSGQIKLFSTAATYAEVDLVGWYSAIENDGGNIAHTLDPAVLVDTIGHTGTCTVNGTTSSCTKLQANQTTMVDVTGSAGVPATGASAIAVVIHSSLPTASGAMTAYSTDATGITGMTLALDPNEPFASTTAIVPIGHDGNINLLSSTNVDVIIQTIGWFEPATKTYTYTYSGDGLRRTKTGPDGTLTTFTWDRSTPDPELLAEAIDAPGTTNDKTIRYVYGPDGTVTADVTTSGTTDTLRWYHHDQLGSTRAITDTTGTIIGTYAYSPYGKLTTITGTASTPIGWAGQYRDTETGYTYLRARYYDPATASFLALDPLVNVTRAPYNYGNNDPVNEQDPSGLIGIGIGPFKIGDGCVLGSNPDGSCRGHTVVEKASDIGNLPYKAIDSINVEGFQVCFVICVGGFHQDGRNYFTVGAVGFGGSVYVGHANYCASGRSNQSVFASGGAYGVSITASHGSYNADTGRQKDQGDNETDVGVGFGFGAGIQDQVRIP
jgi:RHS repeat-associated protein